MHYWAMREGYISYMVDWTLRPRIVDGMDGMAFGGIECSCFRGVLVFAEFCQYQI